MLSPFRRSLRMGPIRVNLSASGIGVSAGIRGARVSVGPRGTYVSLTAHGFQYRKKLDSGRDRPPAPRPAQSPPAIAITGIAGAIPTASVASLQQTSPDDVAREIQRCAERRDWFKAYSMSAALGLLLALLGLDTWAAVFLALLLLTGGFYVYRWNAERRTARLVYDIDDPAAMERFALACAIGGALAQSSAINHVHASVPASDAKRSAGASRLLQRTPTHVSQSVFAPIETNLELRSILAGPQELVFLPDRLLVREGSRIAALPYEQIAAAATQTQFIEEGPVPRDTRVVSTTWQYVRKDGAPDRRFKDNRRIPVVLYGEITISSPHGMRIVFQTSRPESAAQAAHALNRLSLLARRSFNDFQAPAPPLQAHSPAPTHRERNVVELEQTMERHLGSHPLAFAPAADLVRCARSKAEMVALLQLLQKDGYGIEPDVRFGGELVGAGDTVAVFRVSAGAPATPSLAYKNAVLLVRLAVTMAAADGDVSDSEVQHIDTHLAAMSDLSEAERTRLAARARLLGRDPPGLAGLKKRIDPLDARQRGAVADLIVAIAAADGRIDPAEVKLLIKLFPMLGFEASDVYRRIHALAGAKAAPAEPARDVETTGVVLDMALVRAKLAESSVVGDLLGSIFNEETPASTTPAIPPVRALDARHSSFVRKLAERSSWARADVEAMTAALGLMPDGALEVVNEAAFEACGSALWSGDDPVEIDGDVMKELCA